MTSDYKADNLPVGHKATDDRIRFPLWGAPAENHKSCINHLGLEICFDEYNYHDSVRVRRKEEIGDYEMSMFTSENTKKKLPECTETLDEGIKKEYLTVM